jgi:hypothetical protein
MQNVISFEPFISPVDAGRLLGIHPVIRSERW